MIWPFIFAISVSVTVVVVFGPMIDRHFTRCADRAIVKARIREATLRNQTGYREWA